MLTNLIIILQYVHISNQYVVYLKLIQCSILIISQKKKKEGEFPGSLGIQCFHCCSPLDATAKKGAVALNQMPEGMQRKAEQLAPPCPQYPKLCSHLPQSLCSQDDCSRRCVCVLGRETRGQS